MKIDTQVQRDVLAELKWEPSVNAAEIGVELKDRAVKSNIEAALKRRGHADAQLISIEVSAADVTLSGTLHSWSERELARHSAWRTSGVRHVVDNITVAH